MPPDYNCPTTHVLPFDEVGTGDDITEGVKNL